MARKTIPHAAIDRFHSLLMDDDLFNEAMMRCAIEVAQYYAGPGAKLDDEDYQLAQDLCCRVSVA